MHLPAQPLPPHFRLVPETCRLPLHRHRTAVTGPVVSVVALAAHTLQIPGLAALACMRTASTVASPNRHTHTPPSSIPTPQSAGTMRWQSIPDKASSGTWQRTSARTEHEQGMSACAGVQVSREGRVVKGEGREICVEAGQVNLQVCAGQHLSSPLHGAGWGGGTDHTLVVSTYSRPGKQTNILWLRAPSRGGDFTQCISIRFQLPSQPTSATLAPITSLQHGVSRPSRDGAGERWKGVVVEVSERIQKRGGTCRMGSLIEGLTFVEREREKGK